MFFEGEEKIDVWQRLTVTTHRVIFDGIDDERVVIPVASVTHTRVRKRTLWGGLVWILLWLALGAWWYMDKDDPTFLVGPLAAALPGLFFMWRFGALYVSISSAGGKIEHRQFSASKADYEYARAFCRHVEQLALVHQGRAAA